MNRALVTAVLATITFATASASADGPGFGARAHTVLVLDNLAGVMRETYGTPDDPGERGLTAVGTGSGIYAYGLVTRFGVHQFIGDTVSLGAGIHYADRTAGNLEGLGNSATIVAISPRVGFAFPVSGSSAFWFRFGMTYIHVAYDKQGTREGPTANDVLLGGELYYVYTPVEHFGITLGPTLEVGVSGKLKQGDNSVSTRHNLFGLALGFLFDL